MCESQVRGCQLPAAIPNASTKPCRESPPRTTGFAVM